MRLDHLLSRGRSRGCLVIQRLRETLKKYLVSMRAGETPVSIPNTMVKARAAEGTVLATVWESRWMPDFKIVIYPYLENYTLDRHQE